MLLLFVPFPSHHIKSTCGKQQSCSCSRHNVTTVALWINHTQLAWMGKSWEKVQFVILILHPSGPQRNWMWRPIHSLPAINLVPGERSAVDKVRQKVSGAYISTYKHEACMFAFSSAIAKQSGQSGWPSHDEVQVVSSYKRAGIS